MKEEAPLKILSIQQFNLLSYSLPSCTLWSRYPLLGMLTSPQTTWFIPRSVPASFLVEALLC